MNPPKPSTENFSAWDDVKYGLGFLLSVAMWLGGLGFVVIALLA
ncbi:MULTISPECIES: hypothetical protein [unclassified Paraburkholderia]|nr:MULTISPECIES: hypothetical protein [unclassified Paraburkholderia]